MTSNINELGKQPFGAVFLSTVLVENSQVQNSKPRSGKRFGSLIKKMAAGFKGCFRRFRQSAWGMG